MTAVKKLLGQVKRKRSPCGLINRKDFGLIITTSFDG